MAYAIRVAIEDEHLPVELHKAEHVVAPQHEAPNVRSCIQSSLSVEVGGVGSGVRFAPAAMEGG